MFFVRDCMQVRLSTHRSDNGHVIAIKLAFNNLRGSIPESIGSLGYLQHLDLHGNLVTGAIPDLLTKSHVQYIDLSYNKMTGPVPKFTEAYSLRKLVLNNNDFSGIVPAIMNYNLEILLLQNNKLTGHIPISIASLKSAFMVDFSGMIFFKFLTTRN